MTDARSLLMGSGSPSFSFNRFGDSITMQIIAEPKAIQQKVFGTNELAFWPSGDPKMQVVVQGQTAWRNYEGIANPDRSRPDDGIRTVYIKGKHMERAVKEAILASGSSWMDIGGWIQITYTTDDYESKAGIKPKMFDVKYQPGRLPQAPQGGLTSSQHYGQHGQPQHQGYGAPGGYQPPAQPPQAAPAWQQPGWNPQQVVQAVPTSPGGPGMHNAPPFPQPPVQAPAHHGSADTMPGWAAGPTSAPPAPTSAPPAPALSTLDAIRAAQTSATPDYGSIQPAF